MDYRVSSWDSESHEELNKVVNDFLIENEVDVINVSFSSVWHPKKESIVYSVCIVYEFEE
jgi:hypothetical protein